MDPVMAVAAALAEEGRSGLPYAWPERSCVSMVKALCRALGVPEPAYGPWERLGEREATLACLRQYGRMGLAHQTGLVETGRWEAVGREPPVFPLESDLEVIHPRPGDVLSWSGVVLTENDEIYEPRAAGCDMTGLCGPHGFRWVWTKKGLSHVVAGEVAYATRIKPCR